MSPVELPREPAERNGVPEGEWPCESAIAAEVVSLGEFIAIDEPGAAPLLGDADGMLIPEGGDVMVYGDGGAGKTTLLFDLAFHLAAGRPWLQIPVARPARILLIENEGPRPLLRQKLRRKLDAWSGPAPDGRISILERPWATVTFASEAWRQQLAQIVREHRIDVLIAGPLTRLGMDAAGTLQETAAFMRLVDEVRRQSQRLLTVVLVHHENRAGTVSGAWEGAGDTLLHMQAAGNGHSVLYVQKARWASAYHHKTLKLAWADGEGFELEGDRDYVAEIRALLTEHPWRTVKEICAPADEGGIGAGEKMVRDVLDTHSELFELRTGDASKEVGRAGNAKVYGLRSALSAHDAEGALQGGAAGMSASASPLKGRRHTRAPHTDQPNSALSPERRADGDQPGWPRSDDELQAMIDNEDDLLIDQDGEPR